MSLKHALRQLDEAELNQVLQTLQRDFDLRQKEQLRLASIDQALKEEKTKTDILSKQKDFNANCCIRCFKTFSFLFNRRHQCHECGNYACKKCVQYSKYWAGQVCFSCLEVISLKSQTCDWYYDKVLEKFTTFGSSKVVRALARNASKSDQESEHDLESVDSGFDNYGAFHSDSSKPNQAKYNSSNAVDLDPVQEHGDIDGEHGLTRAGGDPLIVTSGAGVLGAEAPPPLARSSPVMEHMARQYREPYIPDKDEDATLTKLQNSSEYAEKLNADQSLDYSFGTDGKIHKRSVLYFTGEFDVDCAMCKRRKRLGLPVKAHH